MNPCDQVAMEERKAVTQAQLGGGDGDSDEGARSTELVLWLKSDTYSAPPSQGFSSLPIPTPFLSTHCPKAFPASPTQLCCSCGQVHFSLINSICVPPMGCCWHTALLTGAWPVHPQTARAPPSRVQTQQDATVCAPRVWSPLTRSSSSSPWSFTNTSSSSWLSPSRLRCRQGLSLRTGDPAGKLGGDA